MPRYNPAVVEPKWQRYWKESQTFKTPDMPVGEKVYVLDMFPYPSGDGLHVGHPEGYTATDITCRYHRMRGRTVLHPMGFDSFGLPAEEHAIKFGQHPAEFTAKNIANFTRQLQALGFSYDWDREIATTDPEYVRWTQWIFTQLFDTWFDADLQKGRPISELPIPAEVSSQGEDAVRRYQDSRRLAYQSEAAVNWCPALGTVLANEEVQGGVSERGGHPVIRLPLKQWMLRITAYADRLEAGLDKLDWPESVKHLQRNWIGRSSGAEVDFFIGAPGAGKKDGIPVEAAFEAWKAGRAEDKFPAIPGHDVLRIYTTRPDTLFGATYMVVAPEHPFVDRLTTPEQADAVSAYRQAAAAKSELDRTSLAKTKSGVFTGSYAINPVNGKPVPVWVADYVLAGYGTGAIMAVPAHDERDFEFAQQFGLPIVAVVDPGPGAGAARQTMLLGQVAFVADGVAINSGVYNGITTAEFKTKIADDLAEFGVARAAVNYKLRDWLFSRQRFWGEPFPVLHELDAQGQPNGLMRTVPPEQLPVLLPPMSDYKPHGRPEPMLAKAPDDWLYVELDGKRYKRELNTMPQWAGSCWYFLRFIDPKNETAFIDPAKEKAWMPVDLYIGGAEHAVLHLLYSRFWHQVLFDRGHVSTAEPFTKLVNQGMILGDTEFTGYQRETGEWVGLQDSRETDDGRKAKSDGAKLLPIKLTAEQVEKSGDSYVLKDQPKIRIDARSYKMSKSRGNVINPDDVVREYGADSLRLYEMFMGPLEATKPWSMAGVNGVRGFLDRAWRMIVDPFTDEVTLSPAVHDRGTLADEEKLIQKTIQAVTLDIERLSFNTAIARLMEFVNHFTKLESRPRSALDRFVLLLSPFAPHLAEELWELLGNPTTLAYERWPTFDPALVRDDEVEIPVSILGKVRGKVVVPAGSDAATIEAAARIDSKIAAQLEGKTIVKVIAVPGRMVNFVVK
ncbi:MAG TPA: leucine--tRNA ligase [Pirellulales bacterium]